MVFPFAGIIRIRSRRNQRQGISQPVAFGDPAPLTENKLSITVSLYRMGGISQEVPFISHLDTAHLMLAFPKSEPHTISHSFLGRNEWDLKVASKPKEQYFQQRKWG